VVIIPIKNVTKISILKKHSLFDQNKDRKRVIDGFIDDDRNFF
jgi:hypothetical protein